MIAGVCIGFGVLYVFIGLRRPSDRARNLLFASFALAYAGAILGARSAYLAASVEQAAVGSQVGWAFAMAGFSFLTWYVATYTGVRPRKFLWALTGAFSALGLASILFPDLIGVTTGITTETLPWNETIQVQSEPGLLFPFALIAQIAMIAYLISADVIQFRRGQRPESLALAIGLGWFAFTILEEALVTGGAIDFVVLSDFGFLGFVVAMGLQEARRSIKTEESLVAFQMNLESMVTVRTNELRAAQAELLAQAESQAVIDERNRLAQELHDAVTQLLFSINLISGSLPKLMRKDPEMALRTTGDLQRLTRGALAEMRTLLRELRPQTIVVTDLATLVGQLTDGLTARHDIPTDVRVDFDGELPPDVHLAVYRIAQEALNNVAKHSNASSLVVELTGDDRHVHLSIADDGCGFHTANVAPHRMGLDIMQERASSIGTEVAVASEPNKGTTLVMEWSDNAHG